MAVGVGSALTGFHSGRRSSTANSAAHRSITPCPAAGGRSSPKRSPTPRRQRTIAFV